VDHLLGRIVDALRRRGTLDRTILVVVSDHGEMLGEHGEFGHGHSLYEPVLHVPLLVRYPPRVPAGRRVTTPVSPVGVYATVLHLIGLVPSSTVQVGSLVSVIDGGPHPGPILAEQYRAVVGGIAAGEDPLLERNARFRAYRSGRLKLVDAEPGGTFLFDLEHDPDEARDVSMQRRLEVGGLRDDIGAWLDRLHLPDLAAAATKSAPTSVDTTVRERALGYAE